MNVGVYVHRGSCLNTVKPSELVLPEVVVFFDKQVLGSRKYCISSALLYNFSLYEDSGITKWKCIRKFVINLYSCYFNVSNG